MKTLGLLGGMSWESSIEYERIINQLVRERLGGTASADLIIRSFNFAEIEALQAAGDWDSAAAILITAAQNLESSGAQAIVICTNTMHLLAPHIEAAISIPLIHIADATARAIAESGVHTVALLGTRYTMEKDFYAGRLRTLHGLNVIIPEEPDLTGIHNIIYEELVRGVLRPESKAFYLEAIARLQARGAQGVVAGCTEIEMLIKPEDVDMPLFPTAYLHAQAAVEFALSG